MTSGRQTCQRLALVLLLALAACAPRVQEPGPLAATPVPASLTDDAFIAADGTRLPLRRWLPGHLPPQALVVALHGFNDYSNAFDGIGRFLADRGIAVFAYDQRGFGATAQTGIWPGEQALADDARSVVHQLRQRYPAVPVYALGESMGGAVLMKAATTAPLDADGYILAAPAVWGRVTMPAYQTALLWLTVHTVPWMTLTGRGLNITPSDNIAMLRALSRDPLVLKETRVDAVWGIVNLMDGALAAAPRFDAPALFLYGARDEVVPPGATLRMFDGLPANSPQTIAIYADGYHMLLRDLEAPVVWRDIASWIDDRDAALPSGFASADPAAALPRR